MIFRFIACLCFWYYPIRLSRFRIPFFWQTDLHGTEKALSGMTLQDCSMKKVWSKGDSSQKKQPTVSGDNSIPGIYPGIERQ
jgi:hypothetical protein